MLWALPCRAQEPSPLQFDAAEWDFGTVAEDGGKVSHTFGFVNSGQEPISIDRVNASCGCTTPEYPRRVIQSGERGAITVTFDPMGYPHDVSKSVVVISGGGKNHDMLTLKGYVTPRVKTVEDEYPYDMGGGFRIDAATVAFRQIGQGRSSSMVVRYANTSDREVRLEVTAADPESIIGIHAPETVCAGCRGNITLTYDLSDGEPRYGMISDEIWISVDGRKAAQAIHTSMIGIDDFAGQNISEGPKLFLDSQLHNFGEVRRRTLPYTFRMTASNEGDETLYIRSLVSKAGCRTTLREGMSIAPGASLPFELLFYSNRYKDPGEVLETLMIVTNDPLRPVRVIRVAAKIE